MTDYDEKTFGVYIHWPFCAQKCPYCDFNSHVRFGGWDEARFLAAYKREIDWVADLIGPRVATSIFFGGGTPSLMKAETTAAILEHIGKRWAHRCRCRNHARSQPGKRRSRSLPRLSRCGRQSRIDRRAVAQGRSASQARPHSYGGRSQGGARYRARDVRAVFI